MYRPTVDRWTSAGPNSAFVWQSAADAGKELVTTATTITAITTITTTTTTTTTDTSLLPVHTAGLGDAGDAVDAVDLSDSGADDDDDGDDSSDNESERDFEPGDSNVGPDITWQPSWQGYRSRVQRLARLEDPLASAVPAGWPRDVSGPRVWNASDFDRCDGSGNQCFVTQLSPADIAEIEQALAAFKAANSPAEPHAVTRAQFPLANLAAKLDRVCEDVHTGRGFAVLRGLEPARYSAHDNALIYAGVSSYIGQTRAMQGRRNPLVHIRDMDHHIQGVSLRQSPYSNVKQPFHNDMCDILAMYVQSTSSVGGESLLASTATVYNDIATSRPDVIHTLADDSWVWDKHEIPARWETRPLLYNFKGAGPGFCFSRRPITGSVTAPRSEGIPLMTERQAEALDMVHFSAEKNAVSMRLQAGDIQLVNNLAVLHARNAFVDGAPDQRRHIMRLWLRNEQKAWPTPAALKASWDEVYCRAGQETPWDVLCERVTKEHLLRKGESCS